MVNHSGKKRNRIPLKAETVRKEIRNRIVNGTYPRGSRLPLRQEMGKHFHVSLTTIQNAFDALVEEGLVEPHGKGGTFVANMPPYLTHFVLAMPLQAAAKENGASRLWTALATAAATFATSAARRISVFYRIGENRENKDYHRLLHKVRSHALAGLILAVDPHRVADTPLMNECDIPRVALMPTKIYPDVPAVFFDTDSFFDRALRFLRSQSCRKVAVLSVRLGPSAGEKLKAQIESLGMTTRPYWFHRLWPRCEQGVKQCVHLLMSNPADRPDGLILSDDSIVQQATMGLLAAGVSVPEEVQVVASANFPSPPPSVTPVKRLGFDARRVLEVCTDILRMIRCGKTPLDLTMIPAVFEDELDFCTRGMG